MGHPLHTIGVDVKATHCHLLACNHFLYLPWHVILGTEVYCMQCAKYSHVLDSSIIPQATLDYNGMEPLF